MTEIPKKEKMIAPNLRRRMACWLYEGILLFGVIFIFGYLFSALTQTRHALENRHEQQAFLFIILGIYFAWFWATKSGQTLAMKTWHICVVDVKGQRLTQKRALLRYVLSWIWIIPPLMLHAIFNLRAAETLVLLFGWVLIWAILSRFHPERQFWHDVLAGTRLIHFEKTKEIISK